MKSIPVWAALACALALPLAACNQGDEGGEGEQAKGSGGAKDEGPARTVDITPPRIAKGKEVFQNCTACHGAEGEGRVGMAPSLTSESFLQAATDRMLLETIRNGREGTTMVAWKEQLKAEEIPAVVAYIRSLQPTEPVELDQSPLEGDPAKGADLFRSICATCHGNTGAGYQESGSGSGIGRKAFLDTVSNGYLRYVIKHGKSGTQMKPFAEKSRTAVANLKDEEIEHIIAYLRKNAW